jgi:ferredoxin
MRSGAKTIRKPDVDAWVERLIRQTTVIAPMAGPDGDVLYAEVSTPDSVLWEFENSLQPPKQHILPQTDPIVSIRADELGYHPEPVVDDSQQILFNLRSCDASAIAFLARVHAYDLVDEAVLARIEQTVVITLACARPGPDCFCLCTDSGPFLERYFDLQLTDLGPRLLAEPGSDRGAALLEASGGLFEPASDADAAERARIEAAAKSRFGKQTCHFASAMRRISTGRVAESLWSELADWCLGCGGCTMICPTCYCFSVKDRAQQGSDHAWERCRLWDSCQYPAFTLEASGHNPRAHRKNRIKRRFFHKVSAQYTQRDGAVGCVGCGRCIKVCLGLTDMPAVVTAIRRGAFNPAGGSHA